MGLGRCLGGIWGIAIALIAAPAWADDVAVHEDPVGSGVYAHALGGLGPTLLRYDYTGPWLPPDGSPPITQELTDTAIGASVAGRFALGYWLGRYVVVAAEVGVDATFAGLELTDSDWIEGAFAAQAGLHTQFMLAPYVPLFVGVGVKGVSFLHSSNDEFDPNRIEVEVESVLGPYSTMGVGWVSRSGLSVLGRFETFVGEERHNQDEALFLTLGALLTLGKTWR